MGFCFAHASPSSLSVGPVEPPETQAPKWPLVSMMFGSPYHVSAGTPLHYVIWLMHASTPSYRFPATCPSYVERLTIGGKVVAEESHVLNCSGVGAIPSGVAVGFSMEVQIPAGLFGRTTLTWTLDPPYGFSRVAKVEISE